MKISAEDIRYAAKLAKLRLDDMQAQKMVEDFREILSCFESLGSLDPHGLEAEPFMRKDEVFVFGNKEKLLRNSRSVRNDYITVPKIIE